TRMRRGCARIHWHEQKNSLLLRTVRFLPGQSPTTDLTYGDAFLVPSRSDVSSRLARKSVVQGRRPAGAPASTRAADSTASPRGHVVLFEQEPAYELFT